MFKTITTTFIVTLTFLLASELPKFDNVMSAPTANFLYQGQYDPKYMAYSDFNMLHECDKNGLGYNYNNGLCVQYMLVTE